MLYVNVKSLSSAIDAGYVTLVIVKVAALATVRLSNRTARIPIVAKVFLAML
jgi:hypothetical protein